MGVFGKYCGSGKINDGLITEFSQAVLKLLYYGGMMRIKKVDIYDYNITLLDPINPQTCKDVHFYYNYFEDDSWESAGYKYASQFFYTNKIGSSEFNNVVMAVYCLLELYDEKYGLALENGDILQSEFCIGWINHILKKDFTLKKRFNLWNCAEVFALTRVDYSEPLDMENLMNLLSKESKLFSGGTELSDLLYIINGTDSLVEEELVPETYPSDIFKCKQEIINLISALGKDAAYHHIISLTKKDLLARKKEKNPIIKPLSDISLYLPARTIIYLLCEQLEQAFWVEWKELKDSIYHDEKMKVYASQDILKLREEKQSKPIKPIPTAKFLKQDGYFTFWDTPDELSGKPNYYLSDSDRLYWWDGTEEVIIDDDTEKWLSGIKEQFLSILKDTSDEYNTQNYVKHVIETLNNINERYKRVFAFHDMFYEFISSGNKKEYRAAISLLCKLYEDNAKDGEVIKLVNNWELSSKNVKCNSGRMCIKRYLSLLANKKLRLKYLNF